MLSCPRYGPDMLGSVLAEYGNQLWQVPWPDLCAWGDTSEGVAPTAGERTSEAAMAPRARVDSSWKLFSSSPFSLSMATSSASNTISLQPPAAPASSGLQPSVQGSAAAFRHPDTQCHISQCCQKCSVKGATPDGLALCGVADCSRHIRKCLCPFFAVPRRCAHPHPSADVSAVASDYHGHSIA